MSVADNIKEKIEMGISQQELANELNVIKQLTSRSFSLILLINEYVDSLNIGNGLA